MNKRQLRKSYMGAIVDGLRSGSFNGSLKDSLLDKDRERAHTVERELSDELATRYGIHKPTT